MTHFGNYDPSSFGWKHPPDIVPFSYQVSGLLSIPFPGGVAKGTEALWTALLTELVPMIPGGLKIGENWGYSPRNIAGTNRPSFHSYGLALDLNSSHNGRGLPKGRITQYALPDSTSILVHKYGCEWGGDWSFTDPMHIEIHLSPDEVKGYDGGTAPTVEGSTGNVTLAGLSTAQKIVLAGIAIVGVTIVIASTIGD